MATAIPKLSEVVLAVILRPGCCIERHGSSRGLRRRLTLIGVDIELFRKLRQRLLALDSGKRHLRLEGRGVLAR